MNIRNDFIVQCDECNSYLCEFYLHKSNDDLLEEGEKAVNNTVEISCYNCGHINGPYNLLGNFTHGCTDEHLYMDIEQNECFIINVKRK